MLFSRMIFQRRVGRNPMWISLDWYSFGRFVRAESAKLKSVLMRKTIVINLLLILGYYLILQLLVWVVMIYR